MLNVLAIAMNILLNNYHIEAPKDFPTAVAYSLAAAQCEVSKGYDYIACTMVCDFEYEATLNLCGTFEAIQEGYLNDRTE